MPFKTYTIVHSAFGYGAVEIAALFGNVDDCMFYDFSEMEREIGLKMVMKNPGIQNFAEEVDALIEMAAKNLYNNTEGSNISHWIIVTATPDIAEIFRAKRRYNLSPPLSYIKSISASKTDEEFARLDPRRTRYATWCYSKMIPEPPSTIENISKIISEYAKNNFGYIETSIGQITAELLPPAPRDCVTKKSQNNRKL